MLQIITKINLSKFRFSKLSKNLLFGISLVLGVGLSLNVSVSLGNFVDEYASIASINSYFKTLILDAGFLGGAYSVQLTSGAISSFGFFIGWEFTKNIFMARTFNIIVIFLIMYIFVLKTKKLYNFNQNTNSIFLSAIFIIPWWHGSLYSLGEILSTIIFMISVVIFRSNNKLSMFLFAISIFYGKIIMILPFTIFLIVEFISTDNKYKFFKGGLFFLAPVIFFLIPIHYFYHAGNLYNYAIDFYDLIVSHKGSGLNSLNQNIFEKISNSEFSEWNLLTKYRILCTPLFFLFFIFRLKAQIKSSDSNLYVHMFSSVSILYIWFWIISETKWIRYSQHFMVLVIFFTLYVLCNKNIKLNKYDELLIFIILTPLLSTMLLFFLSIFVIIILLKDDDINNSKDNAVILILLLLTLNSTFLFYETYSSRVYEFQDGRNTILEECLERNIGEECKFTYLGDI